MYKIIKDELNSTTTMVNRLADNACIPFDPANSDYQQFLKDIKEGVELVDAEGNVVTDFVKELP